MTAARQSTLKNNRNVLAEILIQGVRIGSYDFLILACNQALTELPLLADKKQLTHNQFELIVKLAKERSTKLNKAERKDAKPFRGRELYEEAIASGKFQEHWISHYFQKNAHEIEKLMIERRDNGQPINAWDAELKLLRRDVVFQLWSAANIIADGHRSIPTKPDPDDVRQLLSSVAELRDWAEMRLRLINSLREHNENEVIPPILPKAYHNQDFTEVFWFGTTYSFALGVQSSVIKVLWSEWEKTGLGLNQQTIRDMIDAERDNFRMINAFRKHPAFKTMIQSDNRGQYRLTEPKTENATSRKPDQKSTKISHQKKRRNNVDTR